MPTKSILQDLDDKQPYCFISKSTNNLERHHVMIGTANRSKAEKYGLWIYLTHDWHFKVHHDKQLRLKLQQMAQAKFEEIHSHEKWMNTFHKNYI